MFELCVGDLAGESIQNGEIDPSFVVTHPAALEELLPERRHQLGVELVTHLDRREVAVHRRHVRMLLI